MDLKALLRLSLRRPSAKKRTGWKVYQGGKMPKKTDLLYPNVVFTKDPGEHTKGTGWFLWLAPGDPVAGPFELHDSAVDAYDLYKE